MSAIAEKTTILIVDDQPANLITFEAVLESLDCEIIKASSGLEAVDLTLKRGGFGLILMDVQMPNMDGFQTAQHIKGVHRFRSIPIIFITGKRKEKKEVLQGYEAGGIDYLLKPIDADLLRNKIQAFINLNKQKMRIEGELKQTKNPIEFTESKFLSHLGSQLSDAAKTIIGNISLLKDHPDFPLHPISKEILLEISQVGERLEDLVHSLESHN